MIPNNEIEIQEEVHPTCHPQWDRWY